MVLALLFTLVILQLLDNIGPLPDIAMQLWHLDDGTFISSRLAISSLLDRLQSTGPSFGLHLNLKKCEEFWPSGNQDFPEIGAEVQRICHITGGAEFLGSPIFGSDTFFVDSVAKRV